MTENRNSEPQIDQGERRSGSRALTFPFIAILLLQLLGSFLPARFSWGFDYWSLFPRPISVIVLIGALIAVSPPMANLLAGLLLPLAGRVGKLFAGVPRRWWKLAAAIALFAMLYVLRARALVYGDGFMRLAEAADLVLSRPTTEMYLQLPTVLLYHYAAIFAQYLPGWTAAAAFAMINCIGGVLGVLALYRIATLLSAGSCGRWFILLGALSSGAMILFFGYIEHYTWVTMLGLWSIYRGLRYVRGERGPLGMILLSLLAAAFHLLGAAFLLISVAAMFIRRYTCAGDPLGRRLLVMSLIAGVASFLAALVFQLGNLQAMLVPVWPRMFISYWSLRGAHLIDVFNELMLVAPIGVAAVVYSVLARTRRRSPVDPVEALLIISAVVTFVATFWLNPELGAPRDWDLLAVAGFPLSLWGAYRLWQYRDDDITCARCLVPMVVISAMLLIPNLIEKHDLSLATAHLDSALWYDAHYQEDYLRAERSQRWAYTLQRNAGEYDRAIRYLQRRAAAEPGDFSAWRALGEIWFFDRQQHDSGYFYLKQATLHGPNQADSWRKLAEVELKMGRVDDAYQHAIRAIELDSTNANIRTQLVAVLIQQGNYREALVPLQQAYELAPDSCDQVVNLGSMYTYLGVHDSAYYYLMRLPDLDCRSDVAVTGYESLFTSALVLGKLPEAAAALDVLHRAGLNKDELLNYQRRLQRALNARGVNP